MTMRSKVSAMGLLVCVCRKLGFLLLVPSVQHLPRLVCEALRIVLRIGAIEFSCVRILQIVWSRRLGTVPAGLSSIQHEDPGAWAAQRKHPVVGVGEDPMPIPVLGCPQVGHEDRKSTRLNSSHSQISYAVFCLKKKSFARRKPWCAALFWRGTIHVACSPC